MEDKNIRINLFIQQLNKSNALGYNRQYVASNVDYNFKILDNAYEGTGKIYAALKTAIENNTCEECGHIKKGGVPINEGFFWPDG